MKNKLTDLNDHLFAQMERLSEEDMTPEKLDLEINRTKAINSVAKEIVNNGRLMLSGQKLLADGLVKNLPSVLGIEHKD